MNTAPVAGNLLEDIDRYIEQLCAPPDAALDAGLREAEAADGKLVSLEVEPRYAEVAGRNLERAGVGARVEIRVGPALAALPELVREPAFDLIFIDADKTGYPDYLDWSLKLVHSGSLILADNVIRHGAVLQTTGPDESVRAIQEFNRRVASHPRLETILQPIVRKKVDGLAIARVR
jgi:predicted O-methyltransferase YrrM